MEDGDQSMALTNSIFIHPIEFTTLSNFHTLGGNKYD